jgi:hypothetical protein
MGVDLEVPLVYDMTPAVISHIQVAMLRHAFSVLPINRAGGGKMG